ncbi:MAG: hypothetical protein AB7P22_18755 [Vicinamibacterales bacterium]
MLTDDPDTPGSRQWEVNVAFSELRTRSETSRSFPHVDLNYGVGRRIQLKYEVGWLFVQPADQNWQSGLDDSLIGIKWRFAGTEESELKMSLYPQYQFDNGTGSVARGVAEPGPNLLLPIELSRSFGRAAVVGEFGHQSLHDAPDEWVYRLLGALQASDTLELLAELDGTTTSGRRDADVLINIGLRRRLGDQLKLLASAGSSLSNRPGSTHLIAYLGIQLLLGRESDATHP